eukprot:3934686-Rhodomonas_salina.3
MIAAPVPGAAGRCACCGPRPQSQRRFRSPAPLRRRAPHTVRGKAAVLLSRSSACRPSCFPPECTRGSSGRWPGARLEAEAEAPKSVPGIAWQMQCSNRGDCTFIVLDLLVRSGHDTPCLAKNNADLSRAVVQEADKLPCMFPARDWGREQVDVSRFPAQWNLKLAGPGYAAYFFICSVAALRCGTGSAQARTYPHSSRNGATAPDDFPGKKKQQKLIKSNLNVAAAAEHGHRHGHGDCTGTRTSGRRAPRPGSFKFDHPTSSGSSSQ